MKLKMEDFERKILLDLIKQINERSKYFGNREYSIQFDSYAIVIYRNGKVIRDFPTVTVDDSSAPRNCYCYLQGIRDFIN